MVHLRPAIEVHVPLWISGSGHPPMVAIETDTPMGMSPADWRHRARARALTAAACAYRRALQSRRFRDRMLKSNHGVLATLMSVNAELRIVQEGISKSNGNMLGSA